MCNVIGLIWLHLLVAQILFGTHHNKGRNGCKSRSNSAAALETLIGCLQVDEGPPDIDVSMKPLLQLPGVTAYMVINEAGAY